MSISTKILLYTLSTAFLTFLFGIGIIGWNARSEALKNAYELVDGRTREYANDALAEIQGDVQVARTLAHSINALKDISFNERQVIQNRILFELLDKNNNLLSTNVSWELNSFLLQYKKQYGRRLSEFSKDGTSIKYHEKDLNLNGDDPQELYYKAKNSKREELTNPHAYSYNKIDSILETSVLIPIMDNGKFIGLTGVDISLERYKNIVAKMAPYEGSKTWLLANNSNIIASPRNEKLNRSFDKVFPSIEIDYGAKDKITKGEYFSLITEENHEDYYLSFAPLLVGEGYKPWSLVIVTPISSLTEKANEIFFHALFIGCLGLTLLALIITLMTRYISRPLKEMAHKLGHLERGVFNTENRLTVLSNDELGEVARSVNKLIDTMHDTVTFATDIGNGKLNSTYELIGEDDALGMALLEMRKNLLHAQHDEDLRKNQERQQNWIQKGIADSGTILRKRTDDFDEFGYNIISFLVKYINANQGGFFIVDDIDPADIHIRLAAAYAYDKRRIRQKRIEMNEGLVSRCVQERELTYMTNLPENYFKITSGFGETLPKSLVLLPLIFENEVYGVAEIASFEEIEPYKLSFLEQVSERIAAFLANLKTSIRTNVLLERSQIQLVEMHDNEKKYKNEVRKLANEHATLNETFHEFKLLFNTTSNSIGIAHFDTQGVFKEVNEKYLDLYFTIRSNVIGQKHTAISLTGAEDPIALTTFWDTLKSGVQQRRLEKIVKNNITLWIEEIYTPLYTGNREFQQIVCFSWDVTEYIVREQKLRELLNISKT